MAAEGTWDVWSGPGAPDQVLPRLLVGPGQENLCAESKAVAGYALAGRRSSQGRLPEGSSIILGGGD